VVATGVDGIPEQIIEGETGFLVPSGDAATLAERLNCLRQTADLVQTMGAAARRDAACRFSLERMASNYLILYQEMIEEKAGARAK